MNNVTPLAFDFDVKNYTGAAQTSAYALSICPFTFTFDNSSFAYLSDTRVLWDFGDGTTSAELTAQHHYSMPGMYNATLYMYSSANEMYKSNVKTLSVFSYIADNIVLSATSTQLTASTIDNALRIIRYNAWYNQPQLPVIQLRVDNSNATFVDAKSYAADASVHLKATSKFYQPIALPTDIIDYECIDSILTTNDDIYVKLSGTNIVTCLSSDVDSVFAGSSGIATVYYVDDLPGAPIVSAKFDTSRFLDPQNAQLTDALNSEFATLQMVADTMQYQVSSNVAQKLTFSSNGIDAAGSKFNVAVNNFAGAKIPFVVRATDLNNNAVKNSLKLSQVNAISSIANNSIFVAVMSGNAALPCIVRSDFGNLQFYPKGAFFKGYVTVDFEATNIYLSAYAFMTTDQGATATLQGTSNTFNVYSSAGGFIANKFNEDFDYLQTIKSYRFQESLQNTDEFFDTVLGPILGDANAPNNALGKRIYERIANFVSNNASVDECDIQALDSMYQMAGQGLQHFESLKFAAPADLKAQMDLLSINHSKLWGERNRYKQDFNSAGYTNNAIVGKNIGNKLSVATTLLTADSTGDNAFIVAYERFSGKYVLCNTNIPYYYDVSSQAYVPVSFNINTKTYRLEDATTLSEAWGWPLVLPTNKTNLNLEDYYTFYEYKSISQNSQLEGVIDWSNANNTLQQTQSSYTQWIQAGGIMDNMLSYKLSNGLQLIQDSTITNVPGYVSLGFFYLDDDSTTLLLDALSAEFTLNNVAAIYSFSIGLDPFTPASVSLYKQPETQFVIGTKLFADSILLNAYNGNDLYYTYNYTAYIINNEGSIIGVQPLFVPLSTFDSCMQTTSATYNLYTYFADSSSIISDAPDAQQFVELFLQNPNSMKIYNTSYTQSSAAAVYNNVQFTTDATSTVVSMSPCLTAIEALRGTCSSTTTPFTAWFPIYADITGSGDHSAWFADSAGATPLAESDFVYNGNHYTLVAQSSIWPNGNTFNVIPCS